MRRAGLPVLLAFASTPRLRRRAHGFGVTADEVSIFSKPKALTPVGAERAGNKDGTIPAWTGGYTTPAPGWHLGQARPDPFAQEKPLFAITPANVADYADKLPEGQKELFKRHADYRMDVYPTHRTAAFPQSVYDSIARNATEARAAPSGIAYGVEGAAGMAFRFRFRRTVSRSSGIISSPIGARPGQVRISTYVAAPNGRIELASTYDETADFSVLPGFCARRHTRSAAITSRTRHITAPRRPRMSARSYLAWQPLDTARYKFAAWRPDPPASGACGADRPFLMIPPTPTRQDSKPSTNTTYFSAARIAVRLPSSSAKKEMVIPYNKQPLLSRGRRRR